MKRIFVTGTDTEVGKTWVACALVRHLVSTGLDVAVMKPVASGCERTDGGLRNEDAVALMEASNIAMPYSEVNPYTYEPAIAPHIAAAQTGQFPDIEHIASIAGKIDSDVLVIEGAGGWFVPLDQDTLMPELVRAIGADVVLVVGIKLGCINHALLSASQIQSGGFRLRGWVANQVEPAMTHYRENVQTLQKMLDVPMLCEVKWQSKMADFNPEMILD